MTSASRSGPGSVDRSVTGTHAGRGGSMSWTPRPSTDPNVVRSDSCRATSPVSAASSAPVSSRPRSRMANAVTYSAVSGSKSLRNHRRCWANDSGSGLPSRGITGTVLVAAAGVLAGGGRELGGQFGDGGVGEQGAGG